MGDEADSIDAHRLLKKIDSTGVTQHPTNVQFSLGSADRTRVSEDQPTVLK